MISNYKIQFKLNPKLSEVQRFEQKDLSRVFVSKLDIGFQGLRAEIELAMIESQQTTQNPDGGVLFESVFTFWSLCATKLVVQLSTDKPRTD